MQEIEEIKYVLKNNILKIVLIIVVFFFIFYVIFYFNFYIPKPIQEIKENVEIASHFNGFPIKHTYQNLKVSSNNNKQSTIDKTDRHLIIYGGTETGKTTFVKKYIEKHYNKNSVYIYCKDTDEWKGFSNVYEGTTESLGDLENMETFKGTPENRSLIILDDMGNLIPQKTVSSIYTKGRHYYIQIIVLAHKAKDVDNKIRDNVRNIYCTTMNNVAFFKELCDAYVFKLPLENYRGVEFGMIEINLIKDFYIVYDKDMNIYYDSRINIKVVSPNFNIAKYLNVKKFTEREKDEIITFLENESQNTINITNETFLFYLNYYLIHVLNLQPNYSKLKKMVTESRNGLTIKEVAREITENIESVRPVVNNVSRLVTSFT
jgi:hypothetical protein